MMLYIHWIILHFMTWLHSSDKEVIDFLRFFHAHCMLFNLFIISVHPIIQSNHFKTGVWSVRLTNWEFNRRIIKIERKSGTICHPKRSKELIKSILNKAHTQTDRHHWLNLIFREKTVPNFSSLKVSWKKEMKSKSINKMQKVCYTKKF